MSSIELTGKILECGSLLGFRILLDNCKSTKETNITKENLIQLIQKGIKIKDDAAGIIDGNLFIKEEILNRIEEVKAHYDISDKVFDDSGKVIGYMIKEVGEAEEHKVDLNTTWKMAANDMINGVRAVMIKTTGQKLILITSDN